MSGSWRRCRNIRQRDLPEADGIVHRVGNAGRSRAGRRRRRQLGARRLALEGAGRIVEGEGIRRRTARFQVDQPRLDLPRPDSIGFRARQGGHRLVPRRLEAARIGRTSTAGGVIVGIVVAGDRAAGGAAVTSKHVGKRVTGLRSRTAIHAAIGTRPGYSAEIIHGPHCSRRNSTGLKDAGVELAGATERPHVGVRAVRGSGAGERAGLVRQLRVAARAIRAGVRSKGNTCAADAGSSNSRAVTVAGACARTESGHWA